ncbi:hypothetical protein AB1N83_014402, partial [Pleurotus pulmonarius]
ASQQAARPVSQRAPHTEGRTKCTTALSKSSFVSRVHASFYLVLYTSRLCSIHISCPSHPVLCSAYTP